MKLIDKKIKEVKDLQAELDRRTAAEKEAIRLLSECQFKEAVELLKSLDNQAGAQTEQAAPYESRGDCIEGKKIPTMLTIAECVKETGLSYEYIRKLCLQKRIVFVKAGIKYLVNFEKLLAYLNGEGQAKDY